MEEKISATNPGELKGKAPRIRSVSYPSYSIESCYELVGKIDKIFTDVVYTPREDISKHLGISGGSFLMQLSSSVQYDLLELKSGDGYKPTELYKKIKRPLPEENIHDFFVTCFLSPELNKKLFNDFKDKQLPSLDGLANILDRRYSVKGNASTIAAKIFLKNVEWLELIGENSTLRIEGGITQAEEVDPEDLSLKYLKQESPKSVEMFGVPVTQTGQVRVNSMTKEIPIFLKGGREAKITLPIDFTDEDMLRISKVLSAYLP